MLAAGQHPERSVAGVVTVEGGAEGHLPDFRATVRVPQDLTLTPAAAPLSAFEASPMPHAPTCTFSTPRIRRAASTRSWPLHHLQHRFADHQKQAGQPVAPRGELSALPLRFHFLLPVVDFAHALRPQGIRDQEEPVALEVRQLVVGDLAGDSPSFKPSSTVSAASLSSSSSTPRPGPSSGVR